MSFKRISSAALLTFAIVQAAPALAADPSVQQIYDTAESGHVDQAQQMMQQVLRDHPNSAKAHFVSAELYARERDFGHAREELNTAERLSPGLPQVKAEAVTRLQAELGTGSVAARPAWNGAPAAAPVAAPRAHFPLGALLLLTVIVVGVIAMLMRRRQAVVGGYPAQGGYAAGPGMYNGPVVGGGLGSGIAGGLASGLAAGAGIVAGEELAHHFLDGDRRTEVVDNSFDRGRVDDSGNSDMGGNDFGVDDSSSWDDSSSIGGDVGGGDWS